VSAPVHLTRWSLARDRGTDVTVLVYDVTKAESFEEMKTLLQQDEELVPSVYFRALVGNRVDLIESQEGAEPEASRAVPLVSRDAAFITIQLSLSASSCEREGCGHLCEAHSASDGGQDDVLEFVEERGLMYYEVSAKSGYKIAEFKEALATGCVSRQSPGVVGHGALG
jgi:GTPase SAR1 family protein